MERDSREVMKEAGEETIRLCCGDRNAVYGPPEENHARAAQFKAVWRQHMANPASPDSFDECIEMICTKLGRLCHERKRDSLIDIAGYALNAIACL